MKHLYLLLIMCFATSLYSQNLPREWIMLFDCVHTHQKKLETDIFNAINSNLLNFNTSLNHIPAERVSPLMKAFLYRHLLEIPPMTTSKNVRSIVFIEKFFADYEKKYKVQSCAITNWIIESLQSDFRSLQQSGGFIGSQLGASKNPLEAKSVTIQQHISHWIDFLQIAVDNKDSLLINYYGKIVVAAEKTLKIFSQFSPPQPTTITYINWSFSTQFSDQKPIAGPLPEEEKSPAEILERNIPSNTEPNKSKSEAIDEIIKKKKLQSTTESQEEL